MSGVRRRVFPADDGNEPLALLERQCWALIEGPLDGHEQLRDAEIAASGYELRVVRRTVTAEGGDASAVMTEVFGDLRSPSMGV